MTDKIASPLTRNSNSHDVHVLLSTDADRQPASRGCALLGRRVPLGDSRMEVTAGCGHLHRFPGISWATSKLLR